MGAAVTLPIKGRCYCGETAVRASRSPQTVAYCHCVDCRRVTGAPVAAMAAFEEKDLTFTPDEGAVAPSNPGVKRSFCRSCGSPLSSRFDYLPGQVYVPLGLLDQADELVPEVHSYESQRLRWLHIDDSVERFATSSRARLAGSPETMRDRT
ncbi:GFA family protein [Oricola cellulosilytica]|uniref:GFA family protein n=1 Tax=Oricola cellulosilytica TaxID=1429082 RepID=A0A4V2MPL2_9HYPH|nr:GFA family protein [Oricola cellulosilytica]